MSAAPTVSVLIVGYQSAPTLGRCLESLRAQSFTDFEIVLVDNASADDWRNAVPGDLPNLRIAAMADNLGFAAGNNQAAQMAQGRWLALLNPDAYAAPDWLEQLLAAAQTHPDVRCFTSRQLNDADPALLDGLGDVMSLLGVPFRGGYLSPDQPDLIDGEVFSPCGAAMMIERELFLNLGGFDERLFCYCEDVDLGYRLRLIGQPTRLAGRAVVRHTGSASNGGARSAFAVFHGARNRIWVFVANTPPALLWLTLPGHVVFTLLLMTRHVLRGEARSAFKGVAAAFKGLGDALARRDQVQAARTASSADIVRAMSLNPIDWLRAAPVVHKAVAAPKVHS